MKSYSLDRWQKIIEAYENSEGSQRQLAKRFDVSLGFIQKLLHRYRQDGTIEPRPKANGFPPKLAAHESEVREIVEQQADATLKELTERLEQRLGFKVSYNRLHYYLQRLKLTRKKTLHADQAETNRVQNLRGEYWQKVREINPKNLVFIDEMGISLSRDRTHARSPRGQRAYDCKPYNPGSRVSVIGAMTLKGF